MHILRVYAIDVSSYFPLFRRPSRPLPAPCLPSLPRHRIKPPPPVNSTSGEEQHFPLAISPSPIVFEVLHSGESAKKSLVVRNSQAAPLTIERIEVTCLCIRIAPVPIDVGPGETKTLTVSFDSSSEPEFEGGLSVQITGYLSENKIAFQTQAKIDVIR